MRTAADQLAELFEQNGMETITVSDKLNKIGRFLDTMTVIFFKRKQYNIGIVPLYGGLMSYIWEALSTTLLRLLGKKVILIIHGGSIPERMKKDPAKYLRSFKRADIIVCPSAFIQTVLKDYGIESLLIENVVQLNQYTFQPKTVFRPAIFWMRTLEEIYNPEMAVRVGGLLAKKYTGFKMVMAGFDQGKLAELKALATQLNIADKIEFPGYISQQQKEAYAATHDIYICTNRIDNAPVSFIEMMAMGLPIVSVKVGGIPYMLTEGQNGLMVELDDDHAMADAISSIIQHPEKGVALATNGLKYSQQFGAEPVLQKWKSVLQKLDPSRLN